MAKEFKIERLEQVRDIFIFACFTSLEDKKQRKENHGNELTITNERPLLTGYIAVYLLFTLFE